jgi:hypothetical protein
MGCGGSRCPAWDDTGTSNHGARVARSHQAGNVMTDEDPTATFNRSLGQPISTTGTTRPAQSSGQGGAPPLPTPSTESGSGSPVPQRTTRTGPAEHAPPVPSRLTAVGSRQTRSSNSGSSDSSGNSRASQVRIPQADTGSAVVQSRRASAPTVLPSDQQTPAPAPATAAARAASVSFQDDVVRATVLWFCLAGWLVRPRNTPPQVALQALRVLLARVCLCAHASSVSARALNHAGDRSCLVDDTGLLALTRSSCARSAEKNDGAARVARQRERLSENARGSRSALSPSPTSVEAFGHPCWQRRAMMLVCSSAVSWVSTRVLAPVFISELQWTR